jgi:protein-tyrosine-phosphatase
MKNVLFVCTHNAGRSQMAEALFNRLAPEDVRAESAGREPRREGVWPAVVEVMREIGVDLSARRPQRPMPEMQLHADWAVTLACGASCPYVPATVEDWDIPDPAGKTVDEVRMIATRSSCASATCSSIASTRSAATAPAMSSGSPTCCPA